MHPSSIFSNRIRFIDRELNREYYKRPIGLAYITICVDKWDQMWAGEKLAFRAALRAFTDGALTIPVGFCEHWVHVGDGGF